MYVAWPTGVQLAFFHLLRISVSYSAPRDLHRRAAYRICKSSFLIHVSNYKYLIVNLIFATSVFRVGIAF